jgi:hypothetical protein
MATRRRKNERKSTEVAGFTKRNSLQCFFDETNFSAAKIEEIGRQAGAVRPILMGFHQGFMGINFIGAERVSLG